MKKLNFNSKIFNVALIPLYIYILISGFVFMKANYHFDVFKPVPMAFVCIGLPISAYCFSLKSVLYHRLALLINVGIGAMGIYIGLNVSINYMELIASICLIAFSFTIYEVVNKKWVK